MLLVNHVYGVYGDTWRPTATLELDWAVETLQPAAGSVSATLTEKEKEDPTGPKSPTERPHVSDTLHSTSSNGTALAFKRLICYMHPVSDLNRMNCVGLTEFLFSNSVI